MHRRVILELAMPAPEDAHDLGLDGRVQRRVTGHELDTVNETLVRERRYEARDSNALERGARLAGRTTWGRTLELVATVLDEGFEELVGGKERVLVSLREDSGGGAARLPAG